MSEEKKNLEKQSMAQADPSLEESQKTTELEEIVQQEEIEQVEEVRTEEMEANESKEIMAGVTQKNFDRLTNKNQQFIVTLDRQLHNEMHFEVRRKVFEEIVETLLAGQEHSQTAKHIYGTPTELAQVIRDQELTHKIEAEQAPSSDLLIGIDGSLFLGSLFTFVSGLSMVMATDKANTQTYMGVITMIINYIVAGFAMLMTAKNLPNPDAEKGKKGYLRYFLVSILTMVSWFLIVSFSVVILPRSINPVLPGVIYMMIGGVTFALRFYLRRRYNIKGGVF
ncbi:DUF1129 domain-containing protein [Ignavigranum ruoffiae]|uniref:DUF1129 domain-containing protein n=1 Tax=Ignavigranum ruoffiae TaxID=89093 RepID=UPI0020709F60|nr:DUF1129 family protein [Ignavigranum ruoffiae]UPQ86403.1 DUF1129 domain-containing protein [Ignavigranum ruoffiae]